MVHRNRLVAAIEELDRASSSLPVVDDEGSSDCPFAEELYTQKEEKERKVVDGLSHQRTVCLPAIEAEIVRCKRNLSVISSDKGRLNRQEAISGYAEAETAQKAELAGAERKREQTLEAIARAEQALQRSQKKKFPGRKPRRPFEAPMPLSGSSYDFGGNSDVKHPGDGNTGEEVEDLLGMGPLAPSLPNGK